MEIRLNEKITLHPVCLMQGESRASTLCFSLPRTHMGCALHALAWQVRCTNQSTMAFMADVLLPQNAEDEDRFLLPWTVSAAFTGQSGALAVTLVGSNGANAGDGDESDAVVAKFAVEGVEVSPNTSGGEDAPQTPDYFELAILQTGQNATRALESAALAGSQAAAAKQNATAAAQSADSAQESATQAAASARGMEDSVSAAAQSAEDAAQSAADAARSAQQAAGSAQGMDPNVYDPGFAQTDIFALLHGMPPVYTGQTVRVTAPAARITGVCVQGRALQGGSGAPSMASPRPITGIDSADLAINGAATPLPLTAPLYRAENARTGEVLQDERHLNGAETHQLALKTFTGTENFTIWGNQNTTREFATDAMDVATLATGDTMPTALCSHFANLLTPNQIWSASSAAFSASYRIFFRTSHTTAAQFKAWLAQQYAAGTPVQVLYQRATPLSETKADATPALADGENVFAAKGQNAQVQITLKRVFEG